jgi:uncharacterized phage protein (TIGR01671 family)
MSRPIKFRAWDDGKMIYEKDIWHLSLEDNDIYRLAKFFCNVRNDSIIMQFTGLIDKNGADIYEGDIVSFGNRLYEVAINFNGYYLQRYKLWNGKFKPAFAYSMCLITKPRKKGDRGENGGVVESAEVIGNIYQNPELIEKIKDGNEV